jgi:hypothetical protein
MNYQNLQPSIKMSAEFYLYGRKKWRGGFRGLQAHHSYSWLDSDSIYNIIALCPFKWFGAVLELVSKIYLS